MLPDVSRTAFLHRRSLSRRDSGECKEFTIKLQHDVSNVSGVATRYGIVHYSISNATAIGTLGIQWRHNIKEKARDLVALAVLY
jgi:hypothetical protein